MSQLHALAAVRRVRDDAVVLLDGAAGVSGAWTPIVSIGARVVPHGSDPFATIERVVRRRRSRRGPAGTGVVALVAYEPHGPDTRIIEVDASLVAPHGAPPRIDAIDTDWQERARVACDDAQPWDPPEALSTPVHAVARTSLGRTAYLDGVRRVQDHIERGDCYQANLTQRFTIMTDADPFEIYRRLAAATPAPRAAFLEAGSFALASVSPETFVDADADGRVATFPIKGTRRRGGSATEDARSAAELLASEKDRAELVMIVDLMRNDLGRVCRTGSIEVPELATLRSFPAVHHLVARIEGMLRPEVGPEELLTAIFPGGSITGAPKKSAMEILRAIEPEPRGAYTGSLFWFGDDGATRSSILIRSIVIRDREASIGAGGGVVADSDPESEWREANDKARALTRVLGFEPEEAR